MNTIPSRKPKRVKEFFLASLLVRIPGASHTINARPSNLLAQVAFTIAWFEKHRAKPSP